MRQAAYVVAVERVVEAMSFTVGHNHCVTHCKRGTAGVPLFYCDPSKIDRFIDHSDEFAKNRVPRMVFPYHPTHTRQHTMRTAFDFFPSFHINFTYKYRKGMPMVIKEGCPPPTLVAGDLRHGFHIRRIEQSQIG